MRGHGLSLGFAAALLLGLACGDSTQTSAGDCPVGSATCPCTNGGACDAGLACVNGVCITPGGTDSATGTSSAGTTDTSGGASMTGTGTSSGTGTSATTGESDTDPLKLDVGPDPTTGQPGMGCTKIDMLFVLDGSGSMIEERSALAGVGAFTSIVDTLAGLGDGNIDYRIAVTTDNDNGFIKPACWKEPDPWVASAGHTSAEVAAAFNCAVSDFGTNKYEAPIGCEHVLTSATDLLDGDPSGFVRPDALLVLVLVTDVDDYGAYDQQGGNACGIGCGTPPPDLAGLHMRLVDSVKGGKSDGLAAIVVAGDPASNDGQNFCGQPGSCGCDGIDCAVFHADRLYAFTDLLGANGYAGDICGGAQSVPDAVKTALTESIDIACENFDPPS